ncbi:MAG: L-aspartate oxidase [marine benthic group bacterium]|nr:L-aspartate oxidase [Gemmatimonadota bacterium]MCL7984974.1 L-aspartate oxidase [Gemmatimonadota bacterium]
MKGSERIRTDVLVVGSGIAGLSFALKAARYADVLVATKKERVESNTNYAQGGVAAVFDPGDSPDLHLSDTLVAGAGLCHLRAVEELVREGPERIRELIAWGVEFTREEDRFALGREAGHSRRRILHAADLTGREIERALLAAVAAESRIRVLEDHVVWSLQTAHDPDSQRSRCSGALVLDVHGGSWIQVDARAVVLAAGGCAYLYRHTTNPAIATGDGIAMGYAAGAAVANLEFVQFHPTALFPAESRAHLISEAVRGEGAILRRLDGSTFMEDYHPAASLAPRDIVARAIDAEMKASGDPHVLLDLSTIPAERVAERFPYIRGVCLEEGIDIPADPIPVVPAAHYQCGGLLTDWDGRTSLAGLFAAGEIACTGVHGANRLASNSLLEAVVFSHRAAQRLRRDLVELTPLAEQEVPIPKIAQAGQDSNEVEGRIRSLMWEDVGIVRSDERLESARAELDRLSESPIARDGTGPGAFRARQIEFMRDVATLIVRSAQRRRESRGLHYTQSHPYRDNERFLRDTVLVR